MKSETELRLILAEARLNNTIEQMKLTEQVIKYRKMQAIAQLVFTMSAIIFALSRIF